VRAGALGDADLFALEVRQGLGRRGVRHDDGLPVAARGDDGDIVDARLRSLREDRRRVAGVAVIHGPGVDGLQERRAEGELDPAHGNALGREMLFQQLLRLHHQEHGGLLVADAQFRHRARAG
jgi:hypothetical protein